VARGHYNPPVSTSEATGRAGAGGRRAWRRRAVLALLLAALAWAGRGLVVETLGWREEVALRAAGRDPAAGVVASWRPGDPGPRRLARFLEVVAHYLPPDAAAAVVAPGKPPGEEHFVALWTAYLLPRHRVLPRSGALEALDGVAYVIAWELPVDDPRLDELLRHPDGALYRVAR